MPLTLDGSAGIVTANLADASVTTAKIANGAVIATDLAPGVAGTGPAFSAYQGTAQAMSAATATKINFQTEEFDTNNNFDNATTFRFTPTVAGYYQINGGINVATSSSSMWVAIYKNGAIHKVGANAVAAGASVSSLVYLNGTSDYVELWGNVATAQNLVAAIQSTYFNGCLVRNA